MGAIASFIAALFGNIIGWFAALMGKKVSAALIAVGLIVTLTTAFWALIKTLIDGIAVAAPTELTIAASWVIPDNVSICLSAVISAKIARYIFLTKLAGIQTRLT